MVKFYQHTHLFEYSWKEVSIAFWLRYPNPFASHVLGSDVIERYVDSDGVLHTKRIILKKGKLPKWGRRLINISEAYIIEETLVNPKTETLISKTRNLTHARVMQFEETQTFKPSQNPDGTFVKTEARIFSNFGWGLANTIEKFCFNKFEKNLTRSRLGMSYILERLRETQRSYMSPNF